MYQKTIIVGNLGKDPEMRYTPAGLPVASFSVAVSRRWTNRDGAPQEKTTWFRVTCWRKLAELTAEYLKKGSRVLVEGDVDASAYTDREGNARASLELTATNVRFLSAKGGASEAAAMGDGGSNGAWAGDNDLPF
jgi:single-strand DNA-binding protein